MSSTGFSSLLSLARKLNNFYLLEYFTNSCLPFICEGVQVGLISSKVLKELQRFPSVFAISSNSVTFTPNLDNPQARNDALEETLLKLKSEDVFPALRGWRGECYVTRASSSGPELFKMERAGSVLFGVKSYGVHITGYVNHSSKGLCVWFQQRSKTKQTWPGMFDSFVGGGLTESYGVRETAIKEAGEEANVPEDLASNLKPVGVVSFLHESERGIQPDTEYVFDLELPEGFKPSNNDGEVEDFVLVPVKEIPDFICKENFKITSSAIALDWLIRHGIVTPENESYFAEIVELIHLPIHQLFQMKQR